MEQEIKLITKAADYEAEIDELTELILKDINSDKVPLYKKDLTILKIKHTKIINEINKLIKKENSHAK